MDRLDLLTDAATRTRAVNRAFGCQLSPAEVAAQFADDDIDLLIAWLEHTPHADR